MRTVFFFQLPCLVPGDLGPIGLSVPKAVMEELSPAPETVILLLQPMGENIARAIILSTVPATPNSVS